MEVSGLLRRYPVGRFLSSGEENSRLKQKERLDIFPASWLATVRLNSTYLELVGKFYDGKGFLSLAMLSVLLVMFSFVLATIYVATIRPLLQDGAEGSIPVAVITTAMSLVLIGVAYRQLRRESFRLTHYPIRLNRKLRKVYAFEPYSLKIVEADWDQMVFTLSPCSNSGMRITQYEILGHILDEKGVIRVTLPFSIVTANKDAVKAHWEYMRRYMEYGPSAIFDYTPVCLPIADRRETLLLSYQMTLIDDSYPIWIFIAGVLLIPEALGRYFAMRTSQIPQWPEAIEEACRIETDDPFAIDARNNPERFWGSTEKRRSELVASGAVAR